MPEGKLRGSERLTDTARISDFQCAGRYKSSELVTIGVRAVGDQIRATCPHLGAGYGSGYRCANLNTGAGIGSQPSNYQQQLCDKMDRI